MTSTNPVVSGRVLPLWRTVYGILEAQIVDHVIQPGSHIPEIDTARRLGVSRNPVREACRALASDGLVELRPGDGAYVRELTIEYAQALFHTRSILETESARLCAARPDRDHIAALRVLCEEGDREMRSADPLESGDAVRLVALNFEFHAAIIQATGNAVLIEVLANLHRRITWYYRAFPPEVLAHSWHEHSQLVDAIEKGDTDRAGDIMREHCDPLRHVRALEAGRDSTMA